MLAPISWPTPPPGYGPWEQVAYNIAAGLAARGLDVTLFATGNSASPGRLAWVVPVGVSEDPALEGGVLEQVHIASCFARAGEFDLIHNNLDWKPLLHALGTSAPPLVTTVHGFSSPPILGAYYAGASRSFFCSISDADRDPGLDYLATTYNGIDPNEWTFRDAAGDYLLFLARFHPEKGAHVAIEVAKRAGVRLKLAGIPQDDAYFRELVAPHVDGDAVQFLGHVRGKARDQLVGGALALVHMTTRPERFGLTLIEAMACGTPVLGARMGSIPEIVVDGQTGFLCDGVDEAVAAVPRLTTLDRHACRRRVETAFTVERMVDRYLGAYEDALRLRLPPPPSDERLRWRRHDWWDRPQAFTDIPPKPSHAIDVARAFPAPRARSPRTRSGVPHEPHRRRHRARPGAAGPHRRARPAAELLRRARRSGRAARRGPARRAAAGARGPLHGRTLAVKDIIDVAGLPTRAGSSFFRRDPERDAPVVAALRAAGALVVGKTNTHEFAWGVTSENPHFGRTANPWDTARSPGGSSGGSGAAVAAELAEIALGTDTLGSIRIPSALNGVCGLRPATGALPLDDIVPLALGLDTVGPFARDLATVQQLYEIMAGSPLGAAAPRRVCRLRGGRWDAVEAPVAAALDAAAAALRAAGIVVEDVGWWDDELPAAVAVIQQRAARVLHRALFAEHQAGYGEDVRRRVAYALTVGPDEERAARQLVARSHAAWDAATAGYDAALAPAAGSEAPRAPVAETFREQVIPLATPASAFGLPAAAAPIGFGPTGLPLGMQIVGLERDPALALALGRRFQELTDWHDRRPPLAA